MIDALANVALFAGLERAELAPLAAVTVGRSYPAGQVIVNEGDRADTLYFVLSGQVKVFVAAEDGREIVLCVQGPGTYFGDMMLGDGLRSASVMSLEPCRLAALARDVFRDFLVRHPDTALALIGSLVRRTRLMNDQVRDLALLSAYGRLGKLLLSLARKVEGRLVVEERLTQQEIGDRIGTSREMVSRLFKDLKSGGYVRLEAGRIVILRTPPRYG